MLQDCSSCGLSKQMDHFSKTQLAKPNEHRRCRDCVKAGPCGGALSAMPTRCSGCGAHQQPTQFSKAQLAKPKDHRRCRDCVTAGGGVLAPAAAAAGAAPAAALPTCSSCGAHKQPTQFSKTQLARDTTQRCCRDCIALAQTARTCSGCSVRKQTDQFSKSQLSKAAQGRYHKLRCKDCVAEGQKLCNACCVMWQAGQFSKRQLAKPTGQRRCKECVAEGCSIASDEGSEWGSGSSSSDSSCSSGAGPSADTSGRTKRGDRGSAAAAAKGPLVRVRDVQKQYGHLCEIPLRAYMDAGVAWSRNDRVSESDVEAASNAWDARSIAHDIDTQWGSMPWGGAYKDSNHYYGPDCYDYY